MKYSGIGGQAVIEGIMMKNKQEYATAVRKPDGGIEVQKDRYVSMTEGPQAVSSTPLSSSDWAACFFRSSCCLSPSSG